MRTRNPSHFCLLAHSFGLARERLSVAAARRSGSQRTGIHQQCDSTRISLTRVSIHIDSISQSCEDAPSLKRALITPQALFASRGGVHSMLAIPVVVLATDCGMPLWRWALNTLPSAVTKAEYAHARAQLQRQPDCDRSRRRSGGRLRCSGCWLPACLRAPTRRPRPLLDLRA